MAVWNRGSVKSALKFHEHERPTATLAQDASEKGAR